MRPFILARRCALVIGTCCITAAAVAQGTVLVKDIQPGWQGGEPEFMGVLNDKVIFAADDGEHGTEPWVSDGTTDGTFMLHDIADGWLIFSSNPRSGFVYNGHLYFFARTGTDYFYDLWRTDGTVAGTEHFLDIYPGQGDVEASIAPDDFAVLGGYLYFPDAHPTHQNLCGLWRTDGTTAGTELVTGFHDITRRGPTPLEVFDDHLYFSIQWSEINGEYLCRVDVGGTIDTLHAALGGAGHIYYPTAAANGLYFFSENVSYGRQLFWTDGTLEGTHMISAFDGTYGPAGFSSSLDHSWYYLDGDTLLFTAEGDGSGFELWRSDGTVAGPTLFMDVLPGPSSGMPMNFYRMNDRIFFSAFTSSGQDTSAVYVSDGTAEGTLPLFKLAFTEIYGAPGNELYMAANPPRQVYLSHGGVNDTLRITGPEEGFACCFLLKEVIRAPAGYFISGFAEGIGQELFFHGPDVGIASHQRLPFHGVHPVPATDRLFVDADAPSIVRVRNAMGAEVLGPRTLAYGAAVDVSALPDGLYIITGVTDGCSWSARFVKQ